MLVVCVGMRRAASTSQYLITREIICGPLAGKDYGYCEDERRLRGALELAGESDSIIKTHKYFSFFNDEELAGRHAKFLGTYRDIREVTVSLMNANNCTFDKVIRDGWLEKEMEKYYRIAGLKSVLMQDYRVFTVPDLRPAITQIAEFLDVGLDDRQTDRIWEKCRVENLKKEVQEYAGTFRYRTIHLLNRVFTRLNPTKKMSNGLITNRNKKNDLHHNHFAPVQSDWRTQLTDGEKSLLKRITSEWLITAGIEKNADW